jgi:hypothetical protein
MAFKPKVLDVPAGGTGSSQLENHGILLGHSTGAITGVTPSGTSGIAIISQGSSADPVFGTVVVAGGGTGATTAAGARAGLGLGTISTQDANNVTITGGSITGITDLAVADGGTGASTLTGVLTGNGTSAITGNAVTQYAVVIGGASNAVASTSVGSAGQVLQSSGAGVNPAYSTATFPSTATGTGKILRADGTNWAASTATYPDTVTVSTILYGSASNVVSGLATANNGMLVTSATGVPSILAGPGTTGNILQSNAAAAPSFSTATYPSTTTVSQILYSSSSNVVAGLATANDGVLITSHTGVPSLLANGTTGQVLTATTGAPPSWAAAAGGPSAATQAEQETGTSTTVYVSPGRQQFHVSAAKAWVRWDDAATVPTIAVSYNVTSLTDNGTGDTTVNFTTSFSTANYAGGGMCKRDSLNAKAGILEISATAPTAGACRLLTVGDTNAAFDAGYVFCCFFGDQ